MIRLLFVLMPLFNLNGQNNISKATSGFQILDTSRYAVFSYNNAYSFFLSNGKPATLFPDDINLIETLLIKAAQEYNNKKNKYFSREPVPKLESCKFQLIAAVDSKNKKMVYINCFRPWTSYKKGQVNKDQPCDWKTVLVSTDGGGSSFFHLKCNLTDSTYTPIITNSRL